MAKTSTTIGSLVIAMFLFAVLAVAVLTVRHMSSRHPHSYICLFRSNLNGLRVGAAVKFRGVQIGAVREIHLTLDASEGQLGPVVDSKQQFLLPVILDLLESTIRAKGGTGQALQPQELPGLIHDGLRAQLSVENVLTGLLYVELAFHPNTPATLFIKPGTGRYPELPTIPTATEEMVANAGQALARLAKIDFDSLAASLRDTALSVQEFARNREFRDAIATVNRIVQNPALKRSISSAELSLRRVNNASLSATRSLPKSNAKLDAEIENLQKSSTELQTALLQMRSTMASAQLRIAPGSPMTQQFDAKLNELSDASRSIHDIADYLQRNPGGLIRGADLPK